MLLFADRPQPPCLAVGGASMTLPPPRRRPDAPQTCRERALALPMREVDGEVWKSLMVALLRGLEAFGAAVRGE
jgi:hypothetical protein